MWQHAREEQKEAAAMDAGRLLHRRRVLRAIIRGCRRAFPPPPHLHRIQVQGRRGKNARRLETEAEWKARLGPKRWAELEQWWQSHSWHPNRLRHTTAAELRKRFGVEAAQVILGHSTLAERGIRSLPRLPLSAIEDGDKPAPDTQLLYQYLHYFKGLAAAHTSATDMGTDWRNNDPIVEPFVEVYQGDRNNYERPDAPRTAPTVAQQKGSTPEKESIGGWRPKGFINLALLKGYRLAFESSSDHVSTHLSYCNVLVTARSREGILDAIRKRRVYGATDNIIADVRVKAGGVDHLFGEEFNTSEPITLNIHLVGTLKLQNVTIIKDDQIVYTAEPNEKDVKLQWTDPNPTPGKTSYYYVRGQQVPDAAGVDGELVWVSPFWIKYLK